MPNLALSVLYAAITILVNWPLIEAFWRSPQTASFDGMSHLVVGEYYAKHIFPKTWGWAPHWFAGMPFPNFYPPLFYFSAAFLYHILPFSYTSVVKIFLCFLMVALPGLSASIAWFHTKSFFAALSTGCLTIIALSYEEHSFGIGIAATLTRGLFTQLPGYVCLLLWCHFFLRAEQSRRSSYLSMLFLFLVLLSNVHIIPIIGAFFIVMLGCRVTYSFRQRDMIKISKLLQLYIVLGLVPLAAAAFWYVPLIVHLQYLTAIALPAMNITHIATKWMVPCVLTCSAFLCSVARKDRSIEVTALVCIILAVGPAIDSASLLPSFPIQPFRIFASFAFLSCIPIGYLLGRLTTWVLIQPLRYLAFLILMSPFVWDLYLDRSASFTGISTPQEHERSGLQRLISEMPRDQSITNVELRSSLGDPSYLAVNSLLGAEGIDATYSALRESSISSIFMTPLRNSLAETKETWGIETFLAFDQDFLTQSHDQHLNRAAYMGVGHLLTASPMTAAALSRNPRVTLETIFREWHLFRVATPMLRAAVLENEPAVFFGPATFKKRSTWAYDYTRFQEELFFQGKFGTLVARAHNMHLDRSEDLDRFSIAIITEYRYQDVERAYLRLEKYSANNILICIASDDPLFRRILALSNSPNVYIFERLQGNGEDIRPLRHQLQTIFLRLESRSRGIEEATKQSVREVHIANEKIHVFLTQQTAKKIPILIKVSYFPWWHRVDADEPLYMVTPTYMLTYAGSDLTLEFVADSSLWFGLSISLLVVMSTAGILAGAKVTPVYHRLQDILRRHLGGRG